MDPETINAYNEYSEYYFEKYSDSTEGISNYFPIAFQDPQYILDIGSGAGNDLAKLARLGHRVKGIEPSTKLAALSIKNFPVLAGKITIDSLPELKTLEKDEKYDGVVCSAILMHIPQINLFDAIIEIRNHLSKKGRLLVSIPNEYPHINSNTRRDKHGRLFNGLTAGQLSLILERTGFRLNNKWEDHSYQGSDKITWTTFLFRLDAGDSVRPIDSIESILNKDRKVATYKLALFRALAELATKNINAGKWRSNGFVYLPIDLIVDKWIAYYWPLFESDEFIPQIQKESAEYTRQVSFRKPLTRLINQYKISGGYEAFYIDKMKLKLDPLVLHEIGSLKAKIQSTIINGPIKHAGGYNTNRLLGYDSDSKAIAIPEEIWKELTLLGAWIIDATILRWSELTSRLSKGKIKASKVIDFLIYEEKNRQIIDARNIYNDIVDLQCTWSSAPLRKFEVDHIIPFSLWKNNDLWNLVPAKKSVNREKSDKLVTSDQLVKSKPLLVYYWKQAILEEENRFFNEAKILTGRNLDRKNWENELFSRLREAIEYTAYQRGVDRWQIMML